MNRAERPRRSGGVFVGVAVVAAGVLAFTGTPWTPAIDVNQVRDQVEAINDECTVTMADGSTESLDVPQAQALTTAVVQGSTDAPEGVTPEAMQRLAAGPSNEPGPVLTCQIDEDESLTQQELTQTGLTPRAQEVLDSITQTFGEQSVGGFAPGGVDSGHGAESTHYEGRAVDVFFRPVNEANLRQGWLMSQWLVAHAEQLNVQYVIFDDQYWGVRGSRRGWRDYDAPAPANDILRHRDHIHVDVPRGDAG